MVLGMPSITLKDIPEDLHAQLKREGEANFRSMAQEVLARLQRSFDLDDRFSTEQVNRLVEEAVKSGPERPLTRKDFDAARRKARTQFAARHKAA
jgi:hypothetical protein